MSTEIDKLGATLFGKTRRAVLALLYSHPDESFYLRQIARVTGAGMGSLQRELKQLSEARSAGKPFSRPMRTVRYFRS